MLFRSRIAATSSCKLHDRARQTGSGRLGGSAQNTQGRQHNQGRIMKTYKLVYTLNDDLKRYFIEVEAEDRKAAIELLLNMGGAIGLVYRIVSCRSKQQSKSR